MSSHVVETTPTIQETPVCRSVMPSADYPREGNIAKSLRLFLRWPLLSSHRHALDNARNRAARCISVCKVDK